MFPLKFEVALRQERVRLEGELVALLGLLADREQAHLGVRAGRGSPRRRSRPCGRTGAGAPARASAFAPQSSSTEGPSRAGIGTRDRRAHDARAAGGSRAGPAASIAPVLPAETTASASPFGDRAAGGDERAVRLARARPRPASRPSRSPARRRRARARACPARRARTRIGTIPSAAASSAPATISSGPRSPPIASTATVTVTRSLEARCGAARCRGPCTSCSSGTRDAGASAARRSGRRSCAAPRCRAGRGACRGGTCVVFFLGTAMRRRSIARASLELVLLQRLERRPARVGGSLLLVRVRLVVQVLAARPGRGRRSRAGRGSGSGARGGASRAPRRRGRAGRRRGTASSARRCPGSSPGTRAASSVSSTTASPRQRMHGPVQAHLSRSSNTQPGRGARDRELGRDLLGDCDVALAAELDGREARPRSPRGAPRPTGPARCGGRSTVMRLRLAAACGDGSRPGLDRSSRRRAWAPARSARPRRG